MNAHKANLINAIVLIFGSIWEYLSAVHPSITVFIPLIFGVILLSLNNGVLYSIKSQCRAATFFSLVIVIILVVQLFSVLKSDNDQAILKTVFMLCSSAVASIYLLKGRRAKG